MNKIPRPKFQVLLSALLPKRESRGYTPVMSEEQKNNPLHGVTLEAMLLVLVEKYGWDGLAERIPVRCFSNDPSVKSSLVFLRRTPWARAKVESLYLGKLRPGRKGRGGKSSPRV